MAKRALNSIESGLIKAINAISIVGWIVFITVTFGQVLARYVFNFPFQWAEELARFTLIWFSFLCAVEIAVLDENIDVDIFKPAGLLGFAFDAIKHLCIIATGLLLAFGTWKLYPVVSMSRLPATGLPLSSLYLSAVIAGVGFIVVSSCRLVACVLDIPRRIGR